MGYDVSVATLQMEWAERNTLLKEEQDRIAKLDEEHKDALAVYAEAREVLADRVERMKAELDDLETAVGLLTGT